MRLTLALDFALTRGNRMQDPSKPDELMPLRMIAFNVITTAVAAKYPKGIDDLSANATWARVQRHLNRAVDDEEDSIEISVEGAKFVKAALESYPAPVLGSAPVVKDDLLDHLGEILKSENAAKNGSAKRESAETRA